MGKIVPLILSNVLLLTLGQILWKRSFDREPLVFQGAMILRLIKDPLIWSGLMLFGIATLLWFFVLSKAPLSLAYPLQSICYPLGIAAGFFIFKEQVSFTQIGGIILILSGVFLVGQGV